MEILKLSLLALPFVACYSPDLRDCVVQCASSSDCAGDQTCSAGWCTGSDSCSATTGPDGDVANHNDGGPPVDASQDAPPDASAPDAMIPVTVTLTVSMMGPKGTIRVTGVGDCLEEDAPCVFHITPGLHSFEAIAGDKPFESWTSTLCQGQDETCTATVTGDATLSAKFH
ncbi:hypothetical protein BH11MYX2_BH11MYX2_39550 [soil metagenome]